MRPLYPVLDAVLISYQDLGLISLYWFQWSGQLSEVFFIFRIALFDVDVFEPTCTMDWGFAQMLVLMLGLPVLVARVGVA